MTNSLLMRKYLTIHNMVKYLRISSYTVLGCPSSYMILPPIPSEFPYIWGKFHFLFYQCVLFLHPCFLGALHLGKYFCLLLYLGYISPERGRETSPLIGGSSTYTSPIQGRRPAFSSHKVWPSAGLPGSRGHPLRPPPCGCCQAAGNSSENNNDDGATTSEPGSIPRR